MNADPVLARRERVSRWVARGQRVGYLAFALAILVFVVGFVAGFTEALTSLVLLLLIVACIVLPPAMVFGYGVRAAERHEAEERQRQAPGGH